VPPEPLSYDWPFERLTGYCIAVPSTEYAKTALLAVVGKMPT
jgi:hypothetical protein